MEEERTAKTAYLVCPVCGAKERVYLPCLSIGICDHCSATFSVTQNDLVPDDDSGNIPADSVLTPKQTMAKTGGYAYLICPDCGERKIFPEHIAANRVGDLELDGTWAVSPVCEHCGATFPVNEEMEFHYDGGGSVPADLPQAQEEDL